MRLLYFASVRERIGRPEEELSPPASVGTVGELMDWLRGQGPEYAAALDAGLKVRAAVDRLHVKPESSVRGAREIAFFPPMTGG
jgi:molybdopterin synthase sulfur carrier subunit